MIKITGVNLKEFVKEVYHLSVPQGLGFLHYEPKPLSDEDAIEIVNCLEDDSRIVLSMDYVHGRACKMTVYKKGEGEGEDIYIHDSWYDHTDKQFKSLLSKFNIELNTDGAKHSKACNCNDYRNNRESL